MSNSTRKWHSFTFPLSECMYRLVRDEWVRKPMVSFKCVSSPKNKKLVISRSKFRSVARSA